MATTSFSTLIQNVVNSDKSYTTKRKELVKLGLRANDIALVLPRESSTPPRTQFIYRYGIELETVCPSFDAAAASLSQNGLNVNNARRYFHSNGNTRFELKTDSSIESGYNAAGVEVVSSVLSSTDKHADVKKACKGLVECGAKVNRSTGFHVHISTDGMTDEWYSNVFCNYMYAEAVIDTFMANSRRANNNYYCKGLQGLGLENCHTIYAIDRAMCSRYHKVNCKSWGSHQTIEFRQHGGTINVDKVINWVDFCAALVAWSKDHRLDHAITSIDEMAWLKPKQKTFYKNRAAELA